MSKPLQLRPNFRSCLALRLGSVCATVFVIGSSAAAQTAYEAPPDRWLAHTYGLSATGEYFTSNSNYDTTRGSFTNLLNGNSFSTFETHYRGRYNWTPRFSGFAGLGLGYSSAHDLNNSKTATTATDLSVGADYVLNRRYVSLIPEIQIGFPLNHADPNQTTPLTSDGVSYANAGLFGYRWFDHFRVGGYVGVHFPFEALASRVMYEATVDWHFAPMFTVGAGVDGYETAGSDSTSWLVRNATALKADAGSERFYAYNPALLEARAWVGYRASRSINLRLGYAKSLNGMEVAAGQSFLLYFSYNSPSTGGVGSRAPMRPNIPMQPRTPGYPQPTYAPRTKPKPEEAIDGFAPDVETSPTQELFQQEQDSTEGATPSGADDAERFLEESTKP